MIDTISDIENIMIHKKNDHLFDIYETPIRIEVSQGLSSEVLAEYLSKFYKDTNKITIQDKYLDKPENERNLKNYILKHIDKTQCKIKFILYWESHNKSKLEKKFTNYDEYNSEVTSEKRDWSHPSFIETDIYKIDLGYRLKVFGDIDDGKTEREVITITRKT